jgi:HAD superfamily hydrolase (TIGR01509 family)
VLRAIVFDFNGILVDDEPIHMAALQKVLGEERVELSRDDYYALYLGLDDRGCLAAALAAAGQPAPPERLARLVARKAAYYQAAMRRQSYPFFAGAVELVTAAAAAGLTLGLVSGALREEVEQALGEAGLRRLFKAVVTAEDVAAGKPDPEGYRRALAEFNSQPPLPARLIHPHEALAVEDSPAGLQAAAQAGLVTLGVAHAEPGPELRGADLVAPGLAGLSLARLQQLYVEASRR